MSAKKSYDFVCTECGTSYLRWVGRCNECGQWGSVEENPSVTTLSATLSNLKPLTPTSAAQKITDIPSEIAQASPSGLQELDRVLGGGIVPGSVILLAGEPGVGKSTLLLTVAAKVAAQTPQKPVLYISAEESANQVKIRAKRINSLHPHLYIAAETEIGPLIGQVESLKPSLIIVDSVQTVIDPQISGTAGGNTQVRAVTAHLVRIAKRLHLPIILVGHVTKDGNVAGPRVLEHLVDVVCQFEGDKNSRLRILRALKNRFGPTDEIGCFDMDETGIIELPDPSGLFISGLTDNLPGTCVTITLDGKRALATQVQAIVANSALPSPRRSTSGLDNNRTQMTLAVLQARMHYSLANKDIYIATVAGAKITEPAVDLAVALAVASACKNISLKPSLFACGEISLSGQIRVIPGIQHRLQEAQRLGFTQAVIPADNTLKPVPGLKLWPVRTLQEAVDIALINEV